MICYLYEAPTYLFFAPGLPDLLYYSHIPSVIIAMLVGLFVFLKAPKKLLNRLLLVIAVTFSTWVTLSLLVWAGNDATLFAFIWPFYGILAAFLAIFSIYFIYVFIHKADVPNYLKIVFLLLLLPVLLLSHTDLGVSGFNISYCDAFMFEGIFIKAYYNALGFIAMIWILMMLIPAYKSAGPEFKKQLLLMGIGIEFFLFSFISIIFIVTELTTLGYFENSSLEFYALFGMTFFMTSIGILIVRFKTFNIAAHASQALAVALVILVASQYTYANSTASTIILTTVTLILTALAGLYLNRSVRNEIRQRQEIERLAKDLERSNERLKSLDKQKSEFVSIASHQLRSPLTAIRGYISMMQEGSFGEVPEKMHEPMKRIEDSGRFMATSIDDFLNVSRIESGNMKYDFANVNLVEMTKQVVDDLQNDAENRNLLLLFRTDLTHPENTVYADHGKLMQILHNLINNALKYTIKGSVTVFVHDNPEAKTLTIEFSDTGIGMSKDTIEKLFGKFSRAKIASSANIMGTGLGLFVAREMARAMRGDITAHSEGEGKGSTFKFTMPYEPNHPLV